MRFYASSAFFPGTDGLLFFHLDMSRCNALIVAQCLMNRHCVCFVANYVRLVGNHAAGDRTLLVKVPITLCCAIIYQTPVLILFVCRTGKCQNHALQCGAGIGIFLLVRVRTSSVLFFPLNMQESCISFILRRKGA